MTQQLIRELRHGDLSCFRFVVEDRDQDAIYLWTVMLRWHSSSFRLALKWLSSIRGIKLGRCHHYTNNRAHFVWEGPEVQTLP